MQCPMNTFIYHIKPISHDTGLDRCILSRECGIEFQIKLLGVTALAHWNSNDSDEFAQT